MSVYDMFLTFRVDVAVVQ